MHAHKIACNTAFNQELGGRKEPMLGLLGACLKRQKRFKKPPLFPKMFKT